jgi:beta-phosphoglucomutase family hydrolase
MKYAIIFDMDGVLIDSGRFHLESWQRLAEENGIECSESLFWETFGQTNRQILPRLFERELREEELSRLGDRKEELYREIVAHQAEPMPGVPALIDGLVNRGWRIGIGSSGPRANVELIIDRFALGKIVSAFTSSEDVTHGKPDPEVFLKAAEKMGVDPKACVVVEDAIHGIEAAHRAGMKCIAITTTNPAEALSAADLVIETFEELSCNRVIELTG